MAENNIDKLQIEIEASSTDAAKEVNRLADAMKNLKSAMGGKFNNPIKDIQKSAKSANSVSRVKPQTSGQETSGGGSAEETARKLSTVKELIDGLKIGFAGLGEIGSNAFKKVASGVFTASKMMGGTLLTGVKRAASGVLRLSKNIALMPFNTIKNRVSSAVSAINKFTSAIGRIMMYRAIRALIKNISQAIKEGIDNLSAYSRIVGTDFHKSMDSIATDALYVKNSFATVAAPIINFVKPAFDALADSIANALNLLAQFMARITGASSYSKAIKSVTKYGDAVAKANNKVKQFTISIDELNVISDTAGGGAGAAMPDYESMFEEVPIENIDPEIMDLADRIKKAIDAGDWRGVGAIIADKLNGIIDAWDAYGWGVKFGKKFNDALNLAYGFLTTFDFYKFGSKIAELVNGTLETIDFELWGKVVIRKITSMLDFLMGFFETLDFSSLASAISDYFKGMFDEGTKWFGKYNWAEKGNVFFNKLHDFFTTFDWAGIGAALSDNIKAMLDAAIDFVGAVDWYQLGLDLWNALYEFASNIDWAGIANRMFTLLGEALGAFGSFIVGVLQDSWEAVKEYFNGYIEDAGGNIAEGLLNGIAWALDGIVQWISANVFQPIINGIKETFKIHSPSEETSNLGEMVGEGLLQGMVKKVGAPFAWIKENIGDPILNSFKQFFGIDGEGSSVFSDLGANLVAGLIAGLANVGSKIGEFGNNILTSVKNVLGIHSPSTEFEEIGEYSVKGLANGFSNVTEITKMFQAEMVNCKNAATDFINHVETEIARLSDTINTNINEVSDLYKVKLNEALAHTKNVCSNMTNAYNSMSNNSVSAIGRIIAALNRIPRNIVTVHTIVTQNSGGGGGSNLAVPAYASGGFPEDGLFFANHNELVGSFTNGKTAVANNQEIVAGITAGVENANSEQNALLREQNELLTAILSKTGTFTLDGKTLMTSMEKAQRQRGANIMAGGVRA